MRAIRWSGENDRYFGPFTYAKDRRGYRPLAVELDSGDDDDYPGCRLRLSGFGHTFIMALPAIIKPYRRWVPINTEPTRSQMIEQGRKPGYHDTHRRSFGLSYSEGALHVHYGAQTGDSWTDRTKVWFLPWTQWRHVRRSFYGLDGKHVATLPDTGKSYLGDPGRWERERAIADATPTRTFTFRDYDDEELTATTRIEEREWRFGEGWFKWLSLFRRPKIQRSLDLNFSGETGKRKGSWKGGTIGHSIGMLPGELHEAAFRRYCIEHDMTFVAASGIEAGTDATPQSGAARQGESPAPAGGDAQP